MHKSPLHIKQLTSLDYYILSYYLIFMFTGIIENTGVVKNITGDTENRSAIKLTVDLQKEPQGLRQGQSVALNGVCLTVIHIDGSTCAFELVGETIKKTSLGDLQVGHILNVERSLKVGDRLEGHFVLGHVDGKATITKIQKKTKEVRLHFDVPKRLAKYVIKKGSISVDGISLTVVSVDGRHVSVSLIPHTIQVTNLSCRKVGDKVNIETDILGKYILG